MLRFLKNTKILIDDIFTYAKMMLPSGKPSGLPKRSIAATEGLRALAGGKVHGGVYSWPSGAGKGEGWRQSL